MRDRKRSRLLRNERGLPSWVEALVWGTLPLVHLHTFGFVSLVFAIWTAASGRWREGFASVGQALLPATWGVLLVTGGPGTARLMGWAPGWAIGDQNAALFLVRNFGFWLPLAAVALVGGVRARHREALLLLGPSLALFALLFLVRVAPRVWDNTKVMLWCLVAMLPALDGLVLGRLRPALSRERTLRRSSRVEVLRRSSGRRVPTGRPDITCLGRRASSPASPRRA